MSSIPTSTSPALRLQRALQPSASPMLLCAVLLGVVTARAWMVLAFGSSSPFWDQWDAEIDNLLLPYLRGELGIHHFFAPHNEHRILFTRLISLGLFIVNDGQFDAKVEMLVNVGIHALFIGTLALVGLRTLPSTARPLYCLTVMAIAAVPFGWENLIAGFQNQFFILALLSVVTLWLASADRLDRWRLAAIGTCALLALFTMASGVFAAAAGLGLLTWRLLSRDVDRRQGLAGLCMLVVILVAGLMTMPTAPHGTQFNARDIGEFAQALQRTLAWPLRPRWGSVLVLWLPTFVLALVMLRRLVRRQATSSGERFALAIAGWVLVQAVAMAWSRGVEVHSAVTSRYTDLLAIGVINNVWIVLHAAFRTGSRWPTAARIGGPGLLLCWIAVSSWPLALQSIDGMRHRAALGGSQERVLATYLADMDLDALRASPDLLPYPDADRISRTFAHEEASGLMPPEIRRPLALRWSDCKRLAQPGVWEGVPSNAYAVGTYNPGTGDGNLLDCTSEPVHVDSGRFSFSVAGGSSTNTRATFFSNNHTLELTTGEAAGDRWRSGIATLPAGDYRLRLLDADAQTWTAVVPPGKIGKLSALRLLLTEHRTTILLLALVLLILLLVSAAAASRPRGAEVDA